MSNQQFTVGQLVNWVGWDPREIAGQLYLLSSLEFSEHDCHDVQGTVRQIGKGDDYNIIVDFHVTDKSGVERIVSCVPMCDYELSIVESSYEKGVQNE